MKCFLLVSFLLIFAVIAGCTANKPAIEQGAPGKSSAVTDNNTVASYDYTDIIAVNGLHRSYFVHLPVSYDKSRIWPLVIALHGGGGDARAMKLMTKFDDLADKQGMVIVYPDAYKYPVAGLAASQHWNDGRGEPGIRSQAENIDDVAFISALIDRLVQDLNIDRKMVYVTGISNGAMMSHRLACELSDRIAAIAPVAGNIPQKTASSWSPSRPVSVLMINGTEDPVVPYNGGDVSLLSFKTGRVISVADTVKFWVTQDACPSAPVIGQLPDINPGDGTSTVVERYTGCRNGTVVELYKVVGGGHTWPGGPQYMPEKLIGKTCRDFNAAEVIWQFFKLHPLKQ